LGEHEAAYAHFNRLLKNTDLYEDPQMLHYSAVAAWNTGRPQKAATLWKKASRLDPESQTPKFYLSQTSVLSAKPANGKISELSYHYQLPYEDYIRQFDNTKSFNLPMRKRLKKDPLIHSSFYWGLQYGDEKTKQQIIQVLSFIADKEAEKALREFLQRPKETEYLKKLVIFALRTMGVKEPIHAWMEDKEAAVYSLSFHSKLPEWTEQWQGVVDIALREMDKRYGIIEQYDLQTLWVEYLSRVQPNAPRIVKLEGWAAALEYLTAKMHSGDVVFQELSERYHVSVATIRNHVKTIDEVCGVREKMNAIFPPFSKEDTEN